MKRERNDQDENLGGSSDNFGFFQNNVVSQERGAQKNQRDISDFPDFIQHFLQLNHLNPIPEITTEWVWGKSTYVVDARNLVHPFQVGWDKDNRPLICFRLTIQCNETGILTLYRDSHNTWKYCTCDLNCIYSPFENDDNNSKLGNILTDSSISPQHKVATLQSIFNKPHEISSAPVIR